MTVRIGALQADAWTGLVLSDRPGEGFGLRFAVERASGVETPDEPAVLDRDDFFWLVQDVGPHDPEGRYARVAFDLDRPLPEGPGADLQAPAVLARGGPPSGLDLEWARVGERAVAGRVRCGFEGTLVLRGYFPWDWAGEWESFGEGTLAAFSSSRKSAAAVWVDRPFTGAARREGPSVHGPDAEPGAQGSGPGPNARDEAAFRLAVSPGDAVVFAAAIAGDLPSATGLAEAIHPAAVPGALRDLAAAYDARRARVTGDFQGLAAAVTDNLHWTVLLQPETGATYTPKGRRGIFPRAEERGGGQDHWTVFGWISYLNALALAVEAPESARETLLAGLRTRYSNGCVPNWRGRYGGTPDRSHPPFGSLAALKLHLRRPDVAMLEEAYPLLKAWSDWWVAGPEPDSGSEPEARPRRSPGPRGLLTWGSDRDRIDPQSPPWERGADIRQLAAWESGQDHLPTWDEAEPVEAHGCLGVDPVDLNAYRVLDLECLARIAWELGLDDEAAAHQREADGLRRRVDEHLWDPERETYGDRRWDGSFTPARTASHFLVLAAGIAPDDRARRMVGHLMDSSLFWGDFVVPTLSRDDPRFAGKQSWRGAVRAPINYLIHMGLARCGFDAAAAAVADRGARMFLADRDRTGLCREGFDAGTGEGVGGLHQSWGPLFALTALEELVDVTPWDGLRVGGLRPESRTELTNLDLGPRGRCALALGPEGLALSLDGRPVLQTDAPTVLRKLRIGPRRLVAEVSCEREVSLRARVDGTRWSVELDGTRWERESPEVRVAPGRSRVEIRGLD